VLRRQPARLPDIGKIAVLRANNLGDYLFLLPALEALRAAYPRAEIVLLGTALHRDLLDSRPGPVDRVVVVPPYGGVGTAPGVDAPAADLDRFFATMAAERFDLAIQAHGGGRNSNPFLLRLGARLTAGLCTPDAAPLDYRLPYIYFQPEVFRYLELVSLVGATPTVFEPRLAVTERDRAEALAALPEDDRPLVALHPGATDSRRWWPAEKFAAVGDVLTAAGCRVVVTGVADEAALAGLVVGRMREEAANLCGRLGIGGLTGLLARCALVISNDSGPLHLAAAVDTATVGIYWCLNLINAGPMTRARHRPSLSFRLHCPTCGADCMQEGCGHHESFVADVTVEEVLASARELLGLTGDSSARGRHGFRQGK
jgi:ADP-heptose:LPS heptosyltransferase